jgi:tetratricopeptide (TPR) repeat protein
MDNSFAFWQLNKIIRESSGGFYFILAKPDMQQQIADSFLADDVAIYNYAGKENKYKPEDIFRFIDANEDKKIYFILNFQVPFFGKEVTPMQEDYFRLNMSRDTISDNSKLFFFFMTPETEKNIALVAMDFSGYVNARISFDSIDKERTSQEIQNLPEENKDLHLKPEIEERLARYKETIDEYLNIDLTNYITISEKDRNYLLVAARDLNYYAVLCIKIGNYKEAENLLSKAVEIREKVLGTEHPHTADTYSNIATVYYHQGNYPSALEFYQKALKIDEKVFGIEDSDTATTYNNIAKVYRYQGNYPSALEFYQKALKIREKALGLEHPDTATTYNNIAVVYDNQGDYQSALAFYQKALKIREKALGLEHPDTATTYNNIAVVYDNQGDYQSALTFYQKALKIRESALGLEHPKTNITRNNYETLLRKISVTKLINYLPPCSPP